MMSAAEDLIITEFLLGITGDIKFSVEKTRYLALPVKPSGPSLPMLGKSLDIEYADSKLLTVRKCTKIIQQDIKYKPDIKIKKMKDKITTITLMRNVKALQELRQKMNLQQKPLKSITREKRMSSWVSTLSLSSEGYAIISNCFEI